MKNTDEKVVLVIGASSGIGAEVARRLAVSGLIVYAVARRIEHLKDLEKFNVHISYLDVTNAFSINKVVRQIMDEQGRIDIVINNAGYGEYGMIETVSIEKAKDQFDVNLFGLARVNQRILPIMRRQRQGRIIIVASSASNVSTLGSGWYGASKHAVKALAEALRMEVQGFGIKVIQIEPGPVKTEFEDKAFKTLNNQEVIEGYKNLVYQYSIFLKKMFRKSPSIYTTVNAIVESCLVKKPKPIYRTTISARLLPYIRYIIGVRLYSKCVRFAIQHAGNKQIYIENKKE